jgi:hypothetical protein
MAAKRKKNVQTTEQNTTQRKIEKHEESQLTTSAVSYVHILKLYRVNLGTGETHSHNLRGHHDLINL